MDSAILVVDDDPGIRETVALILEDAGYPVLTATNGAEALTAVEQHHPSCLLLDMRMPVLDGWGVTRALRSRGAITPVIVMTAALDARQWASEIGAAGCLVKPFDISDLLATVTRVCGD